MTVQIQTGYIQIHIEESDWKQYGGPKVKEFLGGLKMAIPPYDREYDPDTYIWSIKDRPEYRKCIEQLRDFYFTDENQIGLFGEL